MSSDRTTETTAPKPEAVALAKAVDAWSAQTSWDWSSDGLEAACWAFHEHMIASSPGLCFHEANGTVRLPTSRDI